MSSKLGQFATGATVPGTRYRVRSLIGRGGMGDVYEVEHVELGKRFVLKALHADLRSREDLIARLRNEWRALAKLEHPNIVNVTDAGLTRDGLPYYVMERLDGDTLTRRLERQRRLRIAEAIAVSRGVLEGLSAAHEIGIVHRDVKPPNVFLPDAGGVKLLDFGIAKDTEKQTEVITAQGIRVGTPRYMAPEQYAGAALDGRTDLYAVGLMLYEMIAGEGPFDAYGREHVDLMTAHTTLPVPDLAASVSGVSMELAAVVQALLAKDPRQRPPSARAAIRMLATLADRYDAAATDALTVQANYGGPTRGATPPPGAAARSAQSSSAARVPHAVVRPPSTQTLSTSDAVSIPPSQASSHGASSHGALSRGASSHGATRVDGLPTEVDAAPRWSTETASSDAAAEALTELAPSALAATTSLGAASEETLPAFGTPVDGGLPRSRSGTRERTERLDLTPAGGGLPSADDQLTRTAYPVLAARSDDGPHSTPPPVVPAQLAPQRWTAGRVLAAAAAALGGFLVTAALLWPRVGPEPVEPSAAAPVAEPPSRAAGTVRAAPSPVLPAAPPERAVVAAPEGAPVSGAEAERAPRGDERAASTASVRDHGRAARTAEPGSLRTAAEPAEPDRDSAEPRTPAASERAETSEAEPAPQPKAAAKPQSGAATPGKGMPGSGL